MFVYIRTSKGTCGYLTEEGKLVTKVHADTLPDNFPSALKKAGDWVELYLADTGVKKGKIEICIVDKL